MENPDASFSAYQIKVFAESVGIKNLPDDAAEEISNKVTTKLKEVIQKAVAFQQHSRHARLTTDDIAYALKWICKDVQIGVSASTPVSYRRLTGQDREIVTAEEPVLKLQDIINAVPKVPRAVRIIHFWLRMDEVPEDVPTSAAPPENERRKPFHSNSNIVQITPVYYHKCSAEEQRLYIKLTETCVGTDEGLRVLALNSCSQDPAMAQLLPYLCIFIAEGVKINVVLQNMHMLIYLVRMMKALAVNPNVYLKAYVHVLIPSAITCVVTRQLSKCPVLEKSWILREFAAEVVVQLIDLCHDDTNKLRERTIRVYQKPLADATAGFFTVYGAMFGLKLLGMDIAKRAILPHYSFIVNCLEKKKSSFTDSDKLAVLKIYQFLSELRGLEIVSTSIQD